MALDSDYRVRGVSYSDGQPSLSLSLAYDSAAGIYGGASALGVDTRHSGIRALGYVIYLGYARRLGPDRSIDFGVSNSQLSTYLDRRYSATYSEIYVGGAYRNISAHLYYSPRYIGEHGSALYVDVDGAVHPARQWRIFAHAGVLRPLASVYSGRNRVDFSVGVARRFKAFEAHVQWGATAPGAYYPESHRQRASALAAGIVAFF